MTGDIVCNRCGAAKPEMAYPQLRGRRVGRVCKACYGEARHHRATATPSGAARYAESRRTWHCPTCGRGYPEAFPATSHRTSPIPPTTPCYSCQIRERHRRRKETGK